MVTNALKWPSNEARKRMESVPLIGKDLFHEEFRSGIEDEATRVESDRKLDRQLGPRFFFFKQPVSWVLLQTFTGLISSCVESRWREAG